MAKAILIIEDKRLFADGHILEVVVWAVPTPVPPTQHGLKYRLFYGIAGLRIVGYDNERGKGDHRHINGVEEPYQFTAVEKLLTDFQADVEQVRGEAI